MKNISVGASGIIVAADVANHEDLRLLLTALKDIRGIVGVKVGFLLAMQGLEKTVNIIRDILHDDVDIIYDHQKAGNDIPDMGIPFAGALKHAGVNGAILFPFAGPETQTVWTQACFDEGLEVLTGGIMTHARFLVSEDGYIDDAAAFEIYERAADLGCRHFVVPGTKIDWVIKIRTYLDESLGVGEFSLHAPGFITQGGDISECGKAAGVSFFPIVGRAIYGKIGVAAQKAAATDIAEKFLVYMSD